MEERVEISENNNSQVKHIADIIGEWGKWQKLLFIYIFFLDIIVAMNNMGYSFHAFKVDYWCEDVPLNHTDISEEFRCYKYENSSKKCTKWNYDKSIFTSTIVTEFDLVCDRSYLASLTQSAYMTGYLLAGILSFNIDKFGRRPIVLGCFCVEIIAFLSCAFSINIYQYIISRMFQGMGAIGRGLGTSSLFIEITGPKYRSDIMLTSGLGWVLGYCCLPGIAILFGHFRYMIIATIIPLIILAIIWWLCFYESPRWQITHNQFDEAEITLEKALKINGKFISDEDLKEKMGQLKKHIESIMSEEESNQISFFDMLRTSMIRKYSLIFWIVFPIHSFIYYSLSYEIGDFGGNYFINFILGGLVEFPSQIVCIIGLRFIGRRAITDLFLITCAISSLLMIPSSTRLSFALIAKFAINSSSWTIGFLRSEIFPTVLRATACGSIVFISRIGAISAPFIKEMGQDIGIYYIFIFYACISIISSGLILLLPETRGREIPDSINETENYVQNRTEVAYKKLNNEEQM